MWNADFSHFWGLPGLTDKRAHRPTSPAFCQVYPVKNLIERWKTMITKENKQNIIKEFAVHEGDTGSPEVQIAILSKRISELTEHLKKNPKDNHSRRGMQQMIGKRRKFLNYLLKNDIERYRSIIERCGIRK